MIWRLVVCLMVSGCGVAHRLRRVPAPTQHVFSSDSGSLASVSVEQAEQTVPYRAEPYRDGLSRPMLISPTHAIVITPAQEEEAVSVRVFVRPVGVPQGPFGEVVAVTGARDRELVDEIRFLPRTVSAPYRLPVADLANVYNGYDLDHDDLILVEVGRGGQVERYLFSNRTVGTYTDVALDLLVRTPIRPGEEGTLALSPALSAGLIVGYRSADRTSGVARAGDRVALQLSLGIGTAALDAARAEGALAETLDQALYSALGGGGVRLFDAVAVQALVNLSAIRGDAPVWTLGVGVDTAKLGALTRDIGARLARPNTLSEPEFAPSPRGG